MGYFSTDEQMEQPSRRLPAPWGLRGAARRVEGGLVVELDWQRPYLPLDGYLVLLTDGRELARAERGEQTHCAFTLSGEQWARADSLSVTVVARRGSTYSPPSVPLVIPLSSLPHIPIEGVIVAPPPAPPAGRGDVPPSGGRGDVSLELEDDLAAIDAALREAQAYLGRNGVFVKLKH